MSYPIKTSDNNWLEKALELSEKRISISITDDSNYNITVDSDVIKLFKRFTLSQTALLLLGAFYVLGIICMVLLYYSFSLQSTKYLGVTLSIVFLIICLGIPTFYLLRNKHPKIEKTEHGIDIKFSSHVF
jgi:hypothetical protein